LDATDLRGAARSYPGRLGLLFFLFYINDIASNIKSDIYVSADDWKIASSFDTLLEETFTTALLNPNLSLTLLL